MTLKDYYVQIPATAKGRQCWTVKASSPEDAIERVRNGNGVFQCDELEVNSLDYDDAYADLNE